MITLKHKGSFKNIEKFLTNNEKNNYIQILNKYGQEGVYALSKATPIDSGVTASSWEYKIKISGTSFTIGWYNTNIVDGVPIAIIIQYGHGTKNGGFVQGKDYINPAIQPIFDKISKCIWKEVTK